MLGSSPLYRKYNLRLIQDLNQETSVLYFIHTHQRRHVHTYIQRNIHTYTQAHRCTHTYTRVGTHTEKHTYVHSDTYTYRHACTFLHVMCTYMHVACTCMHVARIFTYTHLLLVTTPQGPPCPGSSLSPIVLQSFCSQSLSMTQGPSHFLEITPLGNQSKMNY